jgi:hypothetical protein
MRRYESAKHAAETYVQLYTQLYSAGGMDYTSARVEGGELCSDSDGLDDFIALEQAIAQVIHGRRDKALVWKDVFFLGETQAFAAKAHMARTNNKISADTAGNWSVELTGRFETVLAAHGLMRPRRTGDER